MVNDLVRPAKRVARSNRAGAAMRGKVGDRLPFSIHRQASFRPDAFPVLRLVDELRMQQLQRQQ